MKAYTVLSTEAPAAISTIRILIRVLKTKIVGEAEGRPGGCALATSGQQGTEGLFLAPGTTGAGPNLPEGWQESPETGHQTPATRGTGLSARSWQGLSTK